MRTVLKYFSPFHYILFPIISASAVPGDHGCSLDQSWKHKLPDVCFFSSFNLNSVGVDVPQNNVPSVLISSWSGHFITRAAHPISSWKVTKKATGNIRLERQIRQLDGGKSLFIAFSAVRQTHLLCLASASILIPSMWVPESVYMNSYVPQRALVLIPPALFLHAGRYMSCQ